MKKKTIVFLGILLSISIVWFIGFYFFMEKTQDTLEWQTATWNTTLEKIYHDPKTNTTAVKYSTDKNEEDYSYGTVQRIEEYLLTASYQIQRLYDGEEPVNYGRNRVKTDYFYIDLYSLKSGSTVKERSIDIEKILKETNTNYSAISFQEAYVYNGKSLIEISVFNNNIGEYEDVTIDVATEKIVNTDQQEKQADYEHDLITATNFDKLIEVYGLSIEGYSGQTELLVKHAQFDFEEDERIKSLEKMPLLQNNSDLKEFFQVDKDQTYARIFLPEKSGEELLKGLYPADKDVFEQLRLESYTIDGEDHKINSIEQFNQYYKYSPENYEATLAEEQARQLEWEKEHQETEKAETEDSHE